MHLAGHHFGNNILPAATCRLTSRRPCWLTGGFAQANASEVSLLADLVRRGVPPGEWLSPSDVHPVYDGLAELPDEQPHPDGPTGRVAYAMALCCLGEIWLTYHNRPAAAEEYLQRAVGIDPSNALAMCLWGVCIWRSGGALQSAEEIEMPGGVVWRREEFMDKAEDLLFQVLVDWGVDLTLPIRRETVQGKTVFFVDDNALVACFDGEARERSSKYIQEYYFIFIYPIFCGLYLQHF